MKVTSLYGYSGIGNERSLHKQSTTVETMKSNEGLDRFLNLDGPKSVIKAAAGRAVYKPSKTVTATPTGHKIVVKLSWKIEVFGIMVAIPI